MRAPVYDPRESPRHKALLETPGTLAYLPHALRWATQPEVALVALVFGTILGMFANSWLAPFFATLFGASSLGWLLTVQARAAWGYGDAPRLDLEHLNIFRGSVQHLVEFGSAVFGGYGLLLFVGAPATAQVFAYIAGALLPSMFALVALEDALAPALDPRRVARVLLAAGPPGWLLAAAGALVCGMVCREAAEFIATLDAHGIAEIMVKGRIPDPGTVATSVFGLWLLALLVHLQGHALHHHRAVAGLSVMQSAADDDELEQRKRKAAVSRIVTAIERARAAQDRPAVERLAAGPPPDGVAELPYLSDLWERLLVERMYPAAVLVARQLVRVAASQKRYPLAVAVWTEARRLSPSFEPGPAARLALARAALAYNDRANFRAFSAIDAAQWPDDADAAELTRLRADAEG